MDRLVEREGKRERGRGEDYQIFFKLCLVHSDIFLHIIIIKERNKEKSTDNTSITEIIKKKGEIKEHVFQSKHT